MDLHDLMLSKYGAGRAEDLLFNQALAETGTVSGSTGSPCCCSCLRARCFLFLSPPGTFVS